MPHSYPFTALVGQQQVKLALVLNAINPRLGGVLIRGQKGTAKSTAARGLAGLLPPVSVVDGCRFACDPEAPGCPECASRSTSGAYERPAAFVELPIGATEDRVLGTLDLERALSHGERHFESGLLARANRGLLYVDEVNLLPDHLVDTLLDAAAMGVNTVEREGISFSHPAAFVLVGTMNPEEGELRPQLLDRFALAVDVARMPEPAERAEVVRRRIAYEADPFAFANAWQAHESAERARIQAARAVLPRVTLADHLLELIARICTDFDVDGLRADLVIYKAAVTLAAFDARSEVTADDVQRAAELALPHRRRRQPFDQPGLDQERLDRLVQDHTSHLERDEPDDRPPVDRPPDQPPPQDPAGGSDAERGVSEQIYEADSMPRLSISAERSNPYLSSASPTPTRSRRRTGNRVPDQAGRHVRSTAPSHSMTGTLDVAATLLAAAPYQRLRGRAGHMQPLRLEHRDVRVKLRETRAGRCTLFVVDASGSMAAQRRMALAKGAVLSLLLDAYQQRDEVGLIAFRGSSAELLLPPTNSAELASARLRALPTGGRTPLAAALRLAYATLAGLATRRGGLGSALVVLVSDGRANVALADGDPRADALTAARALRSLGVAAVVVDGEDGPVRLGLARRVCETLNGRYLRLADLRPDILVTAVRDA